MTIPPFCAAADAKGRDQMASMPLNKRLAAEIQARWHARGHTNVKVWAALSGRHVDRADGGFRENLSEIHSNLIGGLPPVSHGEKDVA